MFMMAQQMKNKEIDKSCFNRLKKGKSIHLYIFDFFNTNFKEGP